MEITLGALCPLMICGLLSIVLAGTVFAPIQAAARFPLSKTKFGIGELVVLLVQLQVVVAVCLVLVPASDWPLRFSATIFACCTVSVWWWLSAQMLSQARVTRGRDRIWFLALLAPIGFASALSLALLPVWSVFAVIGLLSLTFFPFDNVIVFVGVLCLVSLFQIAMVITCRRFCQRITLRIYEVPEVSVHSTNGAES